MTSTGEASSRSWWAQYWPRVIAPLTVAGILAIVPWLRANDVGRCHCGLGARIDWPRLCQYGKESAALYRCYLSVCSVLDNSAHHGQPITRQIAEPVTGCDGRPQRRKGGVISEKGGFGATPWVWRLPNTKDSSLLTTQEVESMEPMSESPHSTPSIKDSTVPDVESMEPPSSDTLESMEPMSETVDSDPPELFHDLRCPIDSTFQEVESLDPGRFSGMSWEEQRAARLREIRERDAKADNWGGTV